MDTRYKPGKWNTPRHLWAKLKPAARRMRRNPTPSEERLWQRLRNRGLLDFKFRRQHAIDRFIVDFYCAEARLIVEVDGSVHERSVQTDAVRQDALESRGLRVLRFTNSEVDDFLLDVLKKIKEAISQYEEGN